jgi:hypothetical protein
MAAPKKQIRIGVKEGHGHPEYQWSVGILDVAATEAGKILSESQYHHLAIQVQELARQGDPTHSPIVDVRAIEEFHELRDTGGVLGGLNVRVFFSDEAHERWIIILGVTKKQNNGPTPQGDKVRMRRRLRMFRKGQFGPLPNIE